MTTTSPGRPPVTRRQPPQRGLRPAIDRLRGASSWAALGTYVDLRTRPDVIEPATRRAMAILDDIDRTCSRFRADSDLARVNTTPGKDVTVSPTLVAALRVALEAAEETDGLVDPTVGPVLTGAGYDRTFALIVPADPRPVALPRQAATWHDVAIGQGTVRIPEPGLLDLGATGKAFAADLIALTVAEEFGVSVLASVGGDIRVAGNADSGASGRQEALQRASQARPKAFPVALGNTLADAESAPDQVVELDGGGLATSSRTTRSWVRAGRAWHHIIDPRTRSAASGPWERVTALGHTATSANTASTAALILGDEALTWLTNRGVAALLVTAEGRHVTTPAWGLATEEQTR